VIPEHATVFVPKGNTWDAEAFEKWMESVPLGKLSCRSISIFPQQVHLSFTVIIRRERKAEEDA